MWVQPCLIERGISAVRVGTLRDAGQGRFQPRPVLQMFGDTAAMLANADGPTARATLGLMIPLQHVLKYAAQIRSKLRRKIVSQGGDLVGKVLCIESRELAAPEELSLLQCPAVGVIVVSREKGSLPPLAQSSSLLRQRHRRLPRLRASGQRHVDRAFRQLLPEAALVELGHQRALELVALVQERQPEREADVAEDFGVLGPGDHGAGAHHG